MSIFTWLKRLFAGQSYQDSLELYIASKHPTSPGEVEHWIREYDQHKGWAL